MNLHTEAKHFRRWSTVMDPHLEDRAACLPTFLIPAPSASVIRARARRMPVDVLTVQEAIVINDAGTVAFHDVVRERGVIGGQHGYMGVDDDGSPLHTCQDLQEGDMPYVLRFRYAVASSGIPDRSIAYAWSQGACWVGASQFADGAPLIPIAIDYRLEDTRLVLRSGEILPLSVVGLVTGKPLQDVYLKSALDIASYITTAISQLDHVARGCSLIPGASGRLVLTE